MIKIIKEIEQDWYLIHLEGTRYYQIWNKWDFNKHMLEHAGQHTILDEDLPMSEEDLKNIINNLKQK